MTAEQSKALAHLWVLDISRVRAGPTCVRILGDFGADIIKIEAPAGVDPNEGMSGARDGYDMINLHRNKRSLPLHHPTRGDVSVVGQPITLSRTPARVVSPRARCAHR